MAMQAERSREGPNPRLGGTWHLVPPGQRRCGWFAPAAFCEQTMAKKPDLDAFTVELAESGATIHDYSLGTGYNPKKDTRSYLGASSCGCDDTDPVIERWFTYTGVAIGLSVCRNCHRAMSMQIITYDGGIQHEVIEPEEFQP